MSNQSTEGKSRTANYVCASIPAWREQAKAAIQQGQSLNAFLANCHPDNRSNARAAYLMERAASPYEYRNAFGQVISTLADVESATVEEKEIAAAKAGRLARKALLERGLRAMLQAGEIEEARTMAADFLRFSCHP
jgi:hypothetical protein